MVFWIISLFTAIICVYAVYLSMNLKSRDLKVVSSLAFSLLLVGETLDLLAGQVNSSLLAFFAELLEMFITVGFFSLLYYTKIRTEKKKRVKR